MRAQIRINAKGFFRNPVSWRWQGVNHALSNSVVSMGMSCKWYTKYAGRLFYGRIQRGSEIHIAPWDAQVHHSQMNSLDKCLRKNSSLSGAHLSSYWWLSSLLEIFKTTNSSGSACWHEFWVSSNPACFVRHREHVHISGCYMNLCQAL